MQAFNVVNAVYRTYSQGAWLALPDVVGIEWHYARELVKVDDIETPIEGAFILRGVIHTRNPNLLEQKLLSNLYGQMPRLAIRFEYQTDEGKKWRRTFDRVLFGTSGSVGQTDPQQPPDGEPPTHKIAWICAVRRDGSDWNQRVTVIQI